MHLKPIHFIILLSYPGTSYSQEYDLPANTQEAAATYLDGCTGPLEKYLERSQRIQQCLLKKLKRKEARLAKKLAEKDSALYAQYTDMPMGYDSIAPISQDSAALARMPRRKNILIDSLKNIQSFLWQQSGTRTSLLVRLDWSQ